MSGNSFAGLTPTKVDGARPQKGARRWRPKRRQKGIRPSRPRSERRTKVGHTRSQTQNYKSRRSLPLPSKPIPIIPSTDRHRLTQKVSKKRSRRQQHHNFNIDRGIPSRNFITILNTRSHESPNLLIRWDSTKKLIYGYPYHKQDFALLHE